MKKQIILLLVMVQLCITPILIYAQSLKSLDGLTTTLEDVLQRSAVASSSAALAATDNSSGYIGGFPHMSIENGTAVAVSNAKPMLDSLSPFSTTTPADVLTDGAKIPGFGVSNLTTIRVGGIYLRKLQLSIPIETSFSIGIIPKIRTVDLPTDEAKLLFKPIKAYVQGFSIGGGFRTPVYQEQRLIPGVSFGLFYYYAGIEAGMTLPFSNLVGGGVSIQTEVSNADLSLVTPGSITTDIKLNIPDGNAILKISSHTIATKIQAQKHILFIEPYIGIEPTLVIANSEMSVSGIDLQIVSTVNGIDLEFDKYIDEFNVPKELDFAKDGFSLKKSSVSFASRLYAGNTIRIWHMYFSGGLGYEPFNQVVTGNILGRFTF